MNKLYLLIVLPLFVCFPIQGQTTPYYTALEPYLFELQSITTDSSLLIDVREPFEFYRKRIPNAINIPSGSILSFADTINKNCSLFLYCKTGGRASRIARELYGRGFDKIYILEGGIVFWQKEGYKIEKRKQKTK